MAEGCRAIAARDSTRHLGSALMVSTERQAELAEAGAAAVAEARKAVLEAAWAGDLEPLERVAWLSKAGELAELRKAVEAVRSAGATWRVVAEALGDANVSTTRNRFGKGQYARMRRWQAEERQRARTMRTSA